PRIEAGVDLRRTGATHLAERERAGADGMCIPPQISVSGVIGYARCPKSYYWTAVRPLPRSSGPAARRGTEIHRWIERESRGQTSFIDAEPEAPDLTEGDLAGDGTGGEGGAPVSVEHLRETFRASRFAGMVPLHVERSFLLAFGRFTVTGKIDAIFEGPDGAWEVVDWKTGKRPADDDVTRMQLDVYALACMEVWGKRPEDLTTTYVYLQTGEIVSTRPDDAATLRERVGRHLDAIAREEFPATPGPQCTWCDFRSFCAEGTAYLAR
ncbi:MAG: RecB family exonuclease, partial [Actinomycetota bacterium]